MVDSRNCARLSHQSRFQSHHASGCCRCHRAGGSPRRSPTRHSPRWHGLSRPGRDTISRAIARPVAASRDSCHAGARCGHRKPADHLPASGRTRNDDCHAPAGTPRPPGLDRQHTWRMGAGRRRDRRGAGDASHRASTNPGRSWTSSRRSRHAHRRNHSAARRRRQTGILNVLAVSRDRAVRFFPGHSQRW